ncbi:MAG: FAD-binding oxidoreductase [Candidatus Bathyarchaeia archaeon]
MGWERLEKIVGKENVILEDIDLLCYARDLTPYVFKPKAVVFPLNTQHVSEILLWANKERVSVTPRGSGASFTGSSLPRNNSILLDMSKMNNIKEIQPENFLAVTEPGVNVDKLNKHLRKFNLFFPHDVGSHAVSTIGGMAASNAHGHHGLKYGPIRNWIRSLEVVLPTGKVIRTGSKVLQSNCGYNLTQLFIGSEGTLGIITEITFNLAPIPPHKGTIGLFFNDLENAINIVPEIIKSGANPSAIEFVDKTALESVNNVENLGFPEAEAMLIIDIEEFYRDLLEERIKMVMDVYSKFKGKKFQVATKENESEKLWKPRLDIDIAMAKKKPGYREVGLAIADPCVPLSKMSHVINEIRYIFAKHNIVSGILAHAGVGIIHPAIFIDVNDKDQWRELKDAEKEIVDVVLKAKGTITGEHGIGIVKIPFVEMELGETLNIMRQIKAIFDPNGIMNPGKLALDVKVRDSPEHIAFQNYYMD